MAIEIYEGLKFGQMVVLGFNEEETKKIKNKDRTWDCQCSCGNIKTMRAATIRQSIDKCRDTTCDKCKSKIRIYGGLKFGSMTIVNINKDTEECECMCACGKIEIMNYKFIRHSIVCRNNTKCNKCKSAKFAIYGGLKVGKLTVVCFDENATKKSGKDDKIYKCKCECGKLRYWSSSAIRNAISKGADSSCGLCYTFEDWCKDNNHQDYLDLWDYELNGCKPSEISYGAGNKYWFKCQRGIHDSELWFISAIIRRNNMYCRKCNSIGQYLLDTLGEDAIEKYWSKNNTVDPFEIGSGSDRKVILVCQDCCEENKISCSHYKDRNKIPCLCNDFQSYPNKFITSLLKQLKVKYKSEKIFKWAKDKRYDHYMESAGCIIENHGMQHYEHTRRGRSLEEEQANDKLKKELAIQNGIKYYIELDCRKSELEWIKNSVMNSELPELLGFTEDDIDWLGCEKFALSNSIKEACELWDTGEFETLKDLSSRVGVHQATMYKYINIGIKMGWCTYNKVHQRNKVISIMNVASIEKLSTQVEVISKDGFKKIFGSIRECERKAVDSFGVNFTRSSITLACQGKNGKQGHNYKGFTFRYVDSPEQQN